MTDKDGCHACLWPHTHTQAKGDIQYASAEIPGVSQAQRGHYYHWRGRQRPIYQALAPTSAHPGRYGGTGMIARTDGLDEGAAAGSEPGRRKWWAQAAGKKKKRWMPKRKREKKRGSRGAKGSDKTLVVEILAVTAWESNPADALFGEHSYYPPVLQGSQPMLTQHTHFVTTHSHRHTHFFNF